jgi:hypothetical protein
MNRYLTFLIGCLTLTASLHAQNLDNPGEYVTAVFKARGDMDAKYMQYLSYAAHGRRARKIEKLRQEVLDDINNCRYKTTDLPLYKGDNSLRKASIDYIQLCYRVFDEDYKKIVNLEEIAEQSVDEMQIYLLLQEKVNERLKEGSADLAKTTEAFATKYNVQLTEGKSELTGKMETAGKLNSYINHVYLAFFKCNWEDGQMVKAMNDKKVSDVEQARNALSRYTAEGFQSLDSLKAFEGDASLANSCRQMLTFYKNLSEKDMPKLTEYYVKQEDFARLKKSFDANSNHNKEEVDTYNKAIKDINSSINTFNQLNTKVNNGRTQALNNWQETEKKFADDHMPHYH